MVWVHIQTHRSTHTCMRVHTHTPLTCRTLEEDEASRLPFLSTCACSDVVRCLAGSELNMPSHWALAVVCFGCGCVVTRGGRWQSMDKPLYPAQIIRVEPGSRRYRGGWSPFPPRAAPLLELGCRKAAVQRTALWCLALSDEGWRRILSGISSRVLYL